MGRQKIPDGYFFWWGQLGLNQRPIGYEPTALTTELCPRKEKYTISGEKIALRKASAPS